MHDEQPAVIEPRADEPRADEPSDSALLVQAAAGAQAALVELYRRRSHDVYRFAFAMAKSASIAQDVVQEVFLNVLENAARFDPSKGSPRAWLLGCARHVILDRIRLERRWTDEVPDEAMPSPHEDHVLAEQRLDRLHAAITKLPVEYREALVLCELQELSYAECAALLECPIGTVRSRLHRARALLSAALNATETAAGATPAAAAPATAAPAPVLEPSEVCS